MELMAVEKGNEFIFVLQDQTALKIVVFESKSLDDPPLITEIEHSGEKILGAFRVHTGTTLLETGLMTILLDRKYEIVSKYQDIMYVNLGLHYLSSVLTLIECQQ